MANNEQTENDSKKTLHFDNFSAEEFSEWDHELEKWIYGDFIDLCLSLHNFKQNCVDCGDIFVIIEFDVNHDGEITVLSEVKDEIDCSNRAVEEIELFKESMIETFSDVIMPEILRNMIITAPIGKSTHC